MKGGWETRPDPSELLQEVFAGSSRQGEPTSDPPVTSKEAVLESRAACKPLQGSHPNPWGSHPTHCGCSEPSEPQHLGLCRHLPRKHSGNVLRVRCCQWRCLGWEPRAGGRGKGGGGEILLQGSLTQPYRRGRLISTCSKKCTPRPRKGRRCPRLAEAQWGHRHGKSTEGVPEREDSLRTCWLHRSWHGDSREQDVSLGRCPGHLRGHLWDTQQLRRA